LFRFVRRDGVAAGFSAALGVVCLLFIAFTGWRFAEAALSIATPFISSFAVALLLEPLVYRIQRNVGWIRGRRLPAVLLVYLLFLCGFVGLLAYLIPTLLGQGKDLASNFPAYVESLRAFANRYLAAHHTLGPVRLPSNVDALTHQYSDAIDKKLQTYAADAAQIVMGSLAGLLTVVLVPIITFYLLSDFHRLQARLLFLLPEKNRDALRRVAHDVGGVFGNYVRGMLIVCALYGVSATVLFFLFGLRSYALLLGFAAGVLYAVPYIGPLVTAALAAIVAFATGHSPGTTSLLIVLIVVQNQIFDNIFVPRIVGDSVGLHPLLTIFALFLGGEMFGVWGMLLSVPVAASIQIILFRLFPKLREPTPVAMTRRLELRDETITRDEQTADAAEN
jgi:predicted PurR-regulated permease PerM